MSLFEFQTFFEVFPESSRQQIDYQNYDYQDKSRAEGDGLLARAAHYPADRMGADEHEDHRQTPQEIYSGKPARIKGGFPRPSVYGGCLHRGPTLDR